MDRIDLSIIDALQSDSSLSQRALAERVGLSQNACYRRLRRIRESGIIKRYRIELDHARMGLDVTALVMIRTRHHSKTWLEQFRSLVRGIPQVVDFYRIAGDYDYALKIVCRTIGEFDVVYQRMISTIEIETVTSYLAMEVIESQRPTPVGR